MREGWNGLIMVHEARGEWQIVKEKERKTSQQSLKRHAERRHPKPNQLSRKEP